MLSIRWLNLRPREHGAVTTFPRFTAPDRAELQDGHVLQESQIVGSTGYPRVVRIMDEAGHNTGKLVASSRSDIFGSSDHGHTWQLLSTVNSSANGLMLCCCETLF